MHTDSPRLSSQFIIGAASSGSGKTTVTLGLLRALSGIGLAVQPFKCGPDYIDPKYHMLACGRESVNLDTFMGTESHVRQLYSRYSAGADVCLAEGVMGLFDGYDRDRGSSAEIAALLGIPVVLVVDAKAMAWSAAALLYGFANLRKDVETVGVIFNKVGSESHYRCLCQAAEDAGVIPLGWLPYGKAYEVPSRHLGLSLEHLSEYSPMIDAVAEDIRRHVDLDALLRLTVRKVPEPADGIPSVNGGLGIAVASDEAFNFTYRANMDRLAEVGKITCFSPLRDTSLPETDLLYLPGGYPEFYLKELAANTLMLRDIARFAEGGGRILAECGGMMYLCRAVLSEDGSRWPMCGVLPIEATMEGMRLHLGYRTVRSGDFSIRGHEFHYSEVKGKMPSAALQYAADGRKVSTPVYRHLNVLAGYTHLYWAETDPLELFDRIR